MNEFDKSRSQKIEILRSILDNLSEVELDALLAFLETKSLKEYQFTDTEMIRVEESFARYERGETQGMSAEESVRKLTEHLNKIRQKK